MTNVAENVGNAEGRKEGRKEKGKKGGRKEGCVNEFDAIVMLFLFKNNSVNDVHALST